MIRIKRCPYCHGAAHLLIDWDSKRINGYYGHNMLHVLCVLPGHKLNKMQIKPLMNGIIKQRKTRYNLLYFKGGGAFAKTRFRIA